MDALRSVYMGFKWEGAAESLKRVDLLFPEAKMQIWVDLDGNDKFAIAEYFGGPRVSDRASLKMTCEQVRGVSLRVFDADDRGSDVLLDVPEKLESDQLYCLVMKRELYGIKGQLVLKQVISTEDFLQDQKEIGQLVVEKMTPILCQNFQIFREQLNFNERNDLKKGFKVSELCTEPIKEEIQKIDRHTLRELRNRIQDLYRNLQDDNDRVNLFRLSQSFRVCVQTLGERSVKNIARAFFLRTFETAQTSERVVGLIGSTSNGFMQVCLTWV